MSLELTQLQYFIAIANSEHISKTAESLHVSQSTLSMSISRLEHELGISLFYRRGRRIALTNAGKRFARQIGPALDTIENARIELLNLADADGDCIYLSVEAADFASELALRFLQRYPDIQFRQTFDTSKAASERLLRGKVDFCVSYEPFNRPETTSELIWSDRILLLLNAEHPAGEKEAISLEEVKDYPIVTMSAEHGFRRWTDQLCLAAGFHPSVYYEACDLQAITRAVESSQAFSFIAESTWNQYSLKENSNFETGVRAIPITDEHCRRSIYLVYLKDKVLTSSAERFLKFARSMQEGI